MHPEMNPVLRFHGRSMLDKSINSLIGIVEGLAIDQKVNQAEFRYLQDWLAGHDEVKGLHPYNELVPVVAAAVEDGVLTEAERDDIVWLCDRLQSDAYYDHTTGAIQRLHAVLAGIAADRRVTEDELTGLAAWCEQHHELATLWPFDEVMSLITETMRDRRIDEAEHALLLGFFSEFADFLHDRGAVTPFHLDAPSVSGVCAACPEVRFEGRAFSYTGRSHRLTAETVAEAVTRRGGQYLARVSPKLNYLVVGAEGNPAWSYACYGRRIEQAVKLRKSGVPLVLVHELDFFDALADA